MFYKRSVLENVSKFTDQRKKQSSGGVLSKENLFSGVSILIKLQAGNLKPSVAANGDAL